MSRLDIHPASPDERLAAYRNVHDVWSGGLPMAEHLERRLASVQHNRAQWFVGCVANRVVTSLAVYPLQFQLCGRRRQGMAIGSVHTDAAHRGRGFAPKLIVWVEKFQRERGAKLSVLYSDIGTKYYARLGYIACPAHEGWHETAAVSPETPAGFSLTAFNCDDDHSAARAMYRHFHGRRAIFIDRPREYWNHLREKRRDEFHGLTDSAGQSCGYVRLSSSEFEMRIADSAVSENDEALLEGLYRCVIALAARRSCRRVGGWLPDSTASRRSFTVRPRETEITMLKSLDSTVQLSRETIEAADCFSEIDHV